MTLKIPRTPTEAHVCPGLVQHTQRWTFLQATQMAILSSAPFMSGGFCNAYNALPLLPFFMNTIFGKQMLATAALPSPGLNIEQCDSCPQYKDEIRAQFLCWNHLCLYSVRIPFLDLRKKSAAKKVPVARLKKSGAGAGAGGCGAKSRQESAAVLHQVGWQPTQWWWRRWWW